MKQFELPFFGKINVESITKEQEYLTLNFQNRDIVLMWFPTDEIDEKYFQNAKTILSDLDKFDENNHVLLQKEFINNHDKTVLEFLEYHLEEMSEEFSEIIGKSTIESERLQKLLNALKLNTISFHDGSIVADYVLNEEVSDQILAISINQNGENEIAWES